MESNMHHALDRSTVICLHYYCMCVCVCVACKDDCILSLGRFRHSVHSSRYTNNNDA